MNDEHRAIIIESLELNKSILRYDFPSIIDYILKQTNEKWLRGEIELNHASILSSDLQNEVNQIEKTDFSSGINNLDNVQAKMNQKIFSEYEVQTIINALDCSSRLICGQILEVANVLNFATSKHVDIDIVESIMGKIKLLIFKALSLHASYGIYNDNTPIKARIGYEMIQVLRHEIWKNSENQISYIVSAYPVHHETGFPLIGIKKRSSRKTNVESNSK